MKKIRDKNNISEPFENLSSLFIELDYSFLKEPILMNILLKTNITPPIHFSLRSKKIINQDDRIHEIYKNLFGEDKHEDWLHEFIKFTNNFDFIIEEKFSELFSMKYKIKTILILFFNISYNLLKINFADTKYFLEKLLLKNYNYGEICNIINKEKSDSINFGFSLLLELFEILTFYFENYLNIENKNLIKNKLYEEIEISIKNYINIHENFDNLINDSNMSKIQTYEKFFNLRSKRLNSNIIILVDLGFNEKKCDQKILDFSMCMGRYFEIKLTLLRDLNRYKVIIFFKIL